MLEIIQGAILEAYLTPLKGRYTDFGTAENELVARLVEENLDEPYRHVLKIFTIGADRFCYTDPIPVEAGEHRYSLPFKQHEERLRLYDCLMGAKAKGLPIVLIGIGTALSPPGWHELVYLRTPEAELDLRESLLERLAKNEHAKP